MGSYLNPGSDLFEMALQSQIFVDKSGLIEKTNRCVRTLQRYLCEPCETIWKIYGGGYVGGVL